MSTTTLENTHFTDQYQAELNRIQASLLNNRHIRESRQADLNPEYHQNIVNCASALIVLLNNQSSLEIPKQIKAQGKTLKNWWDAWYTKLPDHDRGLVSMHIDGLRALTGLKNLPTAEKVRHPETGLVEPYINIIWKIDDVRLPISEQSCSPSALITAFSTHSIDEKAEATSAKGKWIRFGQIEEKNNLINDILSKLRGCN